MYTIVCVPYEKVSSAVIYKSGNLLFMYKVEASEESLTSWY